MAVSQRRAGIVRLTMNGERLEVAADIEIDPGGITREGLVGMDGDPQGFKGTGRIPRMTTKIRDSATLRVLDLQRVEDATIQAEIFDGKTYTLFRAYAAGEWKINTGDGTVDAIFEGQSMIER
jgi:hypothetical protein